MTTTSNTTAQTMKSNKFNKFVALYNEGKCSKAPDLTGKVMTPDLYLFGCWTFGLDSFRAVDFTAHKQTRVDANGQLVVKDFDIKHLAGILERAESKRLLGLDKIDRLKVCCKAAGWTVKYNRRLLLQAWDNEGNTLTIDPSRHVEYVWAHK